MRTKAALFVIVVGAFTTVAEPTRAQRVQPFYSVMDLGTLGGSYSLAEGINDRGDVVGSAQTDQGDQHAFLFTNGVMHHLGTLGGRTSSASAINARGDVVGRANDSANMARAFLYRNGQMSEVPGLGGTFSSAEGINGRGDVVGGARTGLFNVTLRAFLFRDGTTSDLGILSGDLTSWAFKINARGDITGISVTAGPANTYHGFVYSHGVMSQLNTLGGDISIPADINASDDVVGVSRLADGSLHGFLWSGGDHLIDLGTLPGGNFSAAAANNDSGDVVGSSTVNFVDPIPHAYVLLRGQQMIDLNSLIPEDSGWSNLENAAGINNAGQIVGYGRVLSGEQHAFLLSPSPNR
jgi:probable HAF family extracellular repeat protein